MSVKAAEKWIVAGVVFIAFINSPVSGNCRDTPGKVVYDEISRSWDTCSSSIAKRTGLCYRYKARCCLSCKKYKRADKDCEYGDHPRRMIYIDRKARSCAELTQRTRSFCYRFERFCCETCRKLSSFDYACKYGDSYGKVVWKNGEQVSCQKAITKEEAGICYVSIYAKSCCYSCKKAFGGTEGCVYGDHHFVYGIRIFNETHRTCKEAVKAFPGICYTRSKQCCMSCAAVVKPKNYNCIYGDKYSHKWLYVRGKWYQDCRKAYAAGPEVCNKHRSYCCSTCPPLNPDCPYGDTPGRVVAIKSFFAWRQLKLSCRDAVKSQDSVCHDDSVRKMCCDSCVSVVLMP